MDLRTSALVPVLYVLLGLTALSTLFLAYGYYQSNQRAQLAELELSSVELAAPRPREGDRISSHLGQQRRNHVDAVERTAELEKLLDRKTELLATKSQLLEQRNREYESLKRETAQYLELAAEVLADQPDRQAEDQQATLQQRRAQDLQQEIEDLGDQLQQTEMLETALEMQLDELQQQLAEAQQELANRELDSLVDDDDPTRRHLVRMGAAAVPLLVEALRDESAETRIWALGLLEQIGPAAREAAPLVTLARGDANDEVRGAAARALESIGGP